MKSLLTNIKIKYRLFILVGLALFGLVMSVMISATSMRDNMLREKQDKTRQLVETAHGVVDYFYQLAKSGAIPETDAKSAAVNAIKSLRYDEKEYFWINDMHPTMIMHPLKPELNGKDLSVMADPTGKKLFVEFVDTVKASKSGFVYYLWPKPNFTEPVPKISFVKGFEPWGWIIGSGIYIDDVNAVFWRAILKLAIIMSILLGLILAASWMISRSIVGPVNELTQKVKEISNGDLGVTIEYNGTDEIGEVARGFNVMIGNLRKIVGEINGSTGTLASSSEELSATSDDMHNGANELSSQTEQVVTAMTEVSQTIMDMAKNASQAADASKNASTTAAKGKEIVDTTAADMTRIAETVQDAATTIEELGKSSAKIGEIVAVINGIADQTNLLALNAAIEAARAGDQGRGFAVVADEVRKLAERTGQATKDITSRITGIQQAAGEAVEAMKKGSDEVDRGVSLAREASAALESIVSASTTATDMVQRIAAATEEQSAASEEVSQNMEHIADISRRSSASTEQIKASSADLARLASGLKETTAWFKE